MLPISDAPIRIKPYMTFGLIIVCAIVFLIELVSSDIDAFFQTWAMTPTLVNFNDYKTLVVFVTAIFLHGSYAHIIMNMWYLKIFGDNVEEYLGRIKYFLFFLGGGLVAGLAHYWSDPSSDIPSLGASGAIAAVMGFYIVAFPHSKVKTIFFFGYRAQTYNLSAWVMLGVWFVLQLFSGIGSISGITSDQGIAWWAHIGGFVFGLMVCGVMRLARTMRINK